MPDLDQVAALEHRQWHLANGMPDRWYGACGRCANDVGPYVRPEEYTDGR